MTFSQDKTPLNLCFPINQLGYGQVGINLLKELDKLADVCLFPIGGRPSVDSQELADVVGRCINNSKSLNLHFKAPCIKLWHQNDMTHFAGNGWRIGFPIFELDKFTDIELLHFPRRTATGIFCYKRGNECSRLCSYTSFLSTKYGKITFLLITPLWRWPITLWMILSKFARVSRDDNLPSRVGAQYTASGVSPGVVPHRWSFGTAQLKPRLLLGYIASD